MRWGLAGGGDIAPTRMIPPMRALGQPVSAVASSTLERAEAFAARHSIPAAVADVEQLVAREDVDAVYVSTVNRLHGGHTLLAAGAGKDVLCEKPVAIDLAEAWSMVRVCEVAGVVFRCQPSPPRAHHPHGDPSARRRRCRRPADVGPGVLLLRTCRAAAGPAAHRRRPRRTDFRPDAARRVGGEQADRAAAGWLPRWPSGSHPAAARSACSPPTR